MSFLARLFARRIPAPLLLPVLVAVGIGRLGWAIACRWWLAYPLAAVAGYWWAVHRWGALPVAVGIVAAVLLLTLAGAGWSWLAPDSFGRAVATPWRSWRRGRHYRARWDDAMEGAGLVRADVVPTLMSCRGGGTVDELLVHMAPGSLLTEWRDAAPRLASAFEVRSVRVRRDGPRDVRLLVRRWRLLVDPGGETVVVAVEPDDDELDVEPTTRPTFPRRPS